MKTKYKKQIKKILKNFDFEYVCATMTREKSEWGYSKDDLPEVDALKEIAEILLEDAVGDPNRHALASTHGLMAMKWGGGLSLYFIPTWWEAD